MKLIPKLIILLLFLSVLIIPVSAITVIDEYTDDNWSKDESITGENAGWGQSFTAAETIELTNASMYVKRINITFDLVAKLYTVNGTVGSTAVPNLSNLLATSNTLPASTLSDVSSQNIYFNFSTPYEIQSGTGYAIVVYMINRITGTTLLFGTDQTSPSHSGNSMRRTGSTGEFTPYSSVDVIFGIYKADAVECIPIITYNVTHYDPDNTSYNLIFDMNRTSCVEYVNITYTGNDSSTYALHHPNSSIIGTNQTATYEGQNLSWNYSSSIFTNGTGYWISETEAADTTPPASITSLTNTTGNFWHNWTWTNPVDADFNGTMIYINGNFVENATNTTTFYNLTASAHNESTISTHTFDLSGNVNTTWVNHTSIIPNNAITISCSGWAYIAMNYTYKTLGELDTILSNDVVQAGYDSSLQRYKIHRTGRALNADYNVTQRWGYTAYFSSATNVYVTIPETIPAITLLTGWNLVGHLSTTNTTITAILTDIGANATQGCYADVCTGSTTVPAGEALMVYVTANTIWAGS